MAHCWSRVELEADTARQRRYVPVVAAVGSTAPPPNKLLRKLRDYNRAGLGDIPNTGTAAPAAAARAAARRASEEEEEEEQDPPVRWVSKYLLSKCRACRHDVAGCRQDVAKMSRAGRGLLRLRRG